MRVHLQCDAASAAASSPTPWQSQHPTGWPQIHPATPGWAWAPTLLSLLEAARKLSYSHLELGCGLPGKGKNLWQFFAVFLPWRAMRLKDISKCLFPECCDKMKPALTGTCSLFPSWSLICHCWRLEDLNGSQKQTLPWVCFQMLGAICMCQECFLSLPNLLRARGNLYYFYLSHRRSQLSWSRLQPLHGLLSKSPKLNFPSLTRHHKGSFPYPLGLNTLSPSLSSN